MKMFLIAGLLALSSLAFAYDCQNYESLVSAQIESIEFNDQVGCTVYLNNFDFYSEHAACPLSRYDVKKLGVSFAEEQCSKLQVGDELDGVLVKISTDTIILD